MQISRDISYGGDPGQKLDFLLPDDARAAYVFMHGGGLEGGDKADNAALFDFLTARGIAVISLNYRMLPKAHFPDFVCDGALAVRMALLKLLSAHGLDGRTVLGGSSAGAFIAMLLAFDRSYLAEQSLEPEMLRGFLFDAGQPTCHFALLRERGLDERRVLIDETAPLYHIRDARPARPLMFLTAENDMPGRKEQNALMRRTLINFGYPQHMIESHELPGYGHCGYCGDARPDGFAYGELCADFILRACGEL